MKTCCKPFEKLILQLNWFTYTDEKTNEKILLMPHFIGNDYRQYRINHCPTCGAEVRQFQITETDFFELKYA